MATALRVGLRDVRAVFTSGFGYGLIAGYLVLAGLLLVLALEDGQARLDNWFTPMFVLAGVLCPLLTMRLLAEEERTGSLELLLTAPVRRESVVVGKLLGCVAVYGVVVASTATAPVLVALLGDPDPGPIVTGYVGLMVAGVAFCAIGLAASAATASQLTAASASAGLLLGLWFSAGLSRGLGGRLGRLLVDLSPSSHITGFLRGTLNLPDLVYFAGLTLVGLVVASTLMEERR